MTTSATRVTHSCALLDFNGQRILTDPWFSEKRGDYRGEPLAFTPTTLPALAAVVASHDHFDHFDVDAFSAYPGQVRAVHRQARDGWQGPPSWLHLRDRGGALGGNKRRRPENYRRPGVPWRTRDHLCHPRRRRVVMNAEQAGELCTLLQPRFAVPTHYAFTAGPMRDHLFLKYDGTPERFERAVAQLAPATTARVLAPGEPLALGSPAV